jgi:dipeptidyl aminopeptidase/acylaminoacyl peptidase
MMQFDSPLGSVANSRSPVLLIHGDDDRNVPLQQTTDLVEKLRARNVPISELVMSDEIHDLLRWNNWVRAYKATAEFSIASLPLLLSRSCKDWSAFVLSCG